MGKYMDNKTESGHDICIICIMRILERNIMLATKAYIVTFGFLDHSKIRSLRH